MLFRRKPKNPPPQTIGGIRVSASPRAKRFSLRADPSTGEVIFVWPSTRPATPLKLKQAEDFVRENRVWIDRQQAGMVRILPFSAGEDVVLEGRRYRIVHRAGRGLTRIEGDTVVVTGDATHLSRRLRDFIKKQALARLTALSDAKAAGLGLPPAPVRVIDPKTRWGSCGPDQRLMYSWRLLLAPPAVMDYVVAHEVAHRVHMNHGRKFWLLCESLCDDAAASRKWLKDHGRSLMARG